MSKTGKYERVQPLNDFTSLQNPVVPDGNAQVNNTEARRVDQTPVSVPANPKQE